MWEQIIAYISSYPSVVVTGIDAGGYPYSVRCHVQPDSARQLIRTDLPANAEIQPGPASMMSHYHDENLWNQTSFLVNGKLENREDGWNFRPEKVVGEISQSPLELMRAMLRLRRTASDYLKKHNLPKPQVAYDEIHALWAEVERGKK